jgi:hypothetical protein
LRIFICLGVVIISGLRLFSMAQTTNPTPRDEQEVSAAVAKWLASSLQGDFTALRKLVADDFMGTTFSGQVVSIEDVAPQGGGGSNSRLQTSFVGSVSTPG